MLTDTSPRLKILECFLGEQIPDIEVTATKTTSIFATKIDVVLAVFQFPVFVSETVHRHLQMIFQILISGSFQH